jgi:hypothetical protein
VLPEAVPVRDWSRQCRELGPSGQCSIPPASSTNWPGTSESERPGPAPLIWPMVDPGRGPESESGPADSDPAPIMPVVIFKLRDSGPMMGPGRRATGNPGPGPARRNSNQSPA